MSITYSRTFLNDLSKIYFNGATPPNANNFYLILLGSLTTPNVITDQSTIAQVVANELSSGNGYTTRYNLDFGDATYNTSTNRSEVPQIIVNVTASGGTLSGAGFAILRDATSTIGNTTGGFVAFAAASFSIPDTETRSFFINLFTKLA